MKPVIVIRPQPGCAATVQSARALGMQAYAEPLFTIEPITWQPPAPDSFDALLIGSANAVRHSGAALAAYVGKPAYVVGASTGVAARAAGLIVAATGGNGLQSALEMLQPGHLRLLRIAGEERVELTLREGVTMTERIVYRAVAQPIPPDLLAKLANPTVVLLHSAAAARHFASECARNKLVRSMTSLACIGPRVADAAGEGWATVRYAAQADDKALLALAAHLCQ